MAGTNLIRQKSFSLLLLAALAAIALPGCGNKEGASTPAAVPQPAPPSASAVGPAISEKLTFDQLALESPVKRVQSATGPVYLEFSYVDRDGTIYRCRLPEQMTKESSTPEDWIRLFNLYKLPKAVGKKAAPTQPLVKSVEDFPFISPRPAKPAEQPQTSASETPPPAPAPIQAPPPPPQAGQPTGRGEIDYD